MATKIVTKNSSTSGSAPLASDLVQGELAVNVTDKRLYTENASGTIVEVGTNPSAEIIANGGIALPDNGKATFGAADDLEIYHDGSNSYVSDVGTGRLFLSSNGDGVNIVTNTGENLIRTDSADGRVRLYFDNEEKMRTNATGINVTGNVALGDNDKATFGAGDDLQIYHDGSDSYVDDAGTGDLVLRGNNQVLIRDTGTNEVMGNFRSSGAVTLYYDNAEKISTTATGIDVTGDVSLGDNDKATFGAGDDLEIYHDGGNSIIKEGGSGSLLIRGSNVWIQNADGTETGARFITDGAIDLRYDNAVKLATTSTGIDVTGTATMDGLTVDGATRINQNSGTLEFRSADGTSNGYNLKASVNNTSDFGFFIEDKAGKDLFKVASNNDISFYEDTGTTPKFFWDASAESLGIGTSSPASGLHVLKGTADVFRLERDATNDWRFQLTVGALAFRDATNDAERMRIDSSGNWMLGTTNSNVYTSSTENGLYVTSTGQIRNSVGAVAAYLNRTGSDGTIIDLRKDGATVGSIGTASGTLVIGSTSGADSYIRFGSNAIVPSAVNGSVRDNAIDLGQSNSRFKDLYLSGGVYLGGTGAANKLDDYEEGTWTPVYQSVTNPSGVTYDSGATYGSYTKVGNLVTVVGRIRTDSITDVGSGDLRIGGLPFTVSSSVYAPANLAISNAFASNNPIIGYGNVGSTYIVLMYRSSITGQDLNSQCSDLGVGSNDNSVAFSMSYIV